MKRILFLLVFTISSAGLIKRQAEDFSQFSGTLVRYPEQLPGAFTGGVGEETCHSCHFDYELNTSGGSLSLEGIPDTVTPNKKYTLIITVSRPELGRAGFQLAVRFSDSTQAGRFYLPEDQFVVFTEQIANSIQYVQHSGKGTDIESQTSKSWQLIWQAPAVSSDTIFFNLAANAANGDNSEFGDWIFTRSIKVLP